MRALPKYSIATIIVVTILSVLILLHWHNENKLKNSSLEFLEQQLLPGLENNNLIVLSQWASSSVEFRFGEQIQFVPYLESRNELGSLLNLTSASGEYQKRSLWNIFKPPEAEYILEGQFENGESTLELRLTYSDGSWNITKCIINSSLVVDTPL